MKNTLRHIHYHIKKHLKKHHKKYLFGIFGGFAVTKLFLLVIGLSVVEYTVTSTFAQLATGCELTGQYYTGEYLSEGYLTGQELTGGYNECTTGGGYWTGGTLDELDVLTGQTRVEEYQIECILTGQTLSEGYLTGQELTGGYLTGGTIVCDDEIGTGDDEIGTGDDEEILITVNETGGNGICESDDIIWNAPLSGSIVRDIFSIGWSYSGTDCISGLSLQLRDHNGQWISLNTLASGTTGYNFDSKRLSTSQSSGFYHIFGTGLSGQQIYLYTGIYSGNYSYLSTGYKLKLLSSGTSLYETQSFTIDNQYPTLTGISLLSNGSTTGYLAISGVVTLSFTASEVLSGIQVTLGSGKIPMTSIISGLLYTYTRNLTSLYTEGILVATIIFADSAGNTGDTIYTGLLVFDKTKPVVSSFIFSGNSSGVYLNFLGSEPIRYIFTYQTTGGILLSGMNTEYLTAQQLDFSGIEINRIYIFMLNVFDRAGNTRSITGDFHQTISGNIISHVYIVPITNEVILSGSLATLAVILKAEVQKFNVCKDALTYTPIELEVRHNSFVLQMPTFKKSQIKTLVNAFTLFVLNKIKGNYKLTSDEVTDITKKFDNFLIILKLLRDDDNSCKQNLSNYHISQFKNTLEEYNISMD